MIAPAAVITITIPSTISQCSGWLRPLRLLRCRLAGVERQASPVMITICGQTNTINQANALSMKP